jgi:hypothetical protein
MRLGRGVRGRVRCTGDEERAVEEVLARRALGDCEDGLVM